MTNITRLTYAVLAGLAVVIGPATANAHHPLGGMPMETFGDGLLSGIGHPLLGFDHLFFVVLVGIVAFLAGRRFLASGAYIVAMLAGCAMMAMGVGLPAKEIVIGLSLLVLGGWVLSGRGPGLVAAFALFTVFGLFHGSAFGDSIAEQETAAGASVLVGYLIGLGVLQYATAVFAGTVFSKLFGSIEAASIPARISGGAVAGAGLLMTLEHVEGFVLTALGWGA